jgi:hypothetical protein
LTIIAANVLTALTMQPGRSAGWDNLGQIYAKKGQIPAAVASFVNAYRFSRDPNKTHSYFLGLMGKENDVNLRQALRQATQVGERKFLSAGANLDIKSKNLEQSQEVQTKQIRVLEDFLSKNPGVYDWKVHNELRHLYGEINPRKSMVHSDIILGHSPMDDYILHILSGWQINKDTATARTNLLTGC